MPVPGSSSANRRFRNISDKYTLGEELGKGGFGTVYACRNSETGETVAVKSIGLRNLGKNSLVFIEQEVSLLKNLDHPNIVKYIDTVRTDDHLHIVLEYMENGSLARNLKLFGTLSQSLCALYIRQVLSGLAYLHDQGVIHRDIKGANILTTKQGLIKLADFGVATYAASSAETNEVVGTPYWMAPEVIEMDRPTTACDIWSVGCTIVELLTLKPPYFDIPPMAALYRIVQDEHPPMPEGLSPALREFLLLCFRKEPLMRSTAKDLLRHRWVHKARGIHEPKFVRADGVVPEDGGDSEKEYDAKDKETQKKGIQTRLSSRRRRSSCSDEDNVYAIHERSENPDPSEIPTEVSEKQRTVWRKSVMNTIRLSEEQRAAGMRAQKELEEKKKKQQEEEQDDSELSEEEDWDKWGQENGLEAAARRKRERKKEKQKSMDEEDDHEEEEDDEDDDFEFDFDDIGDSERGKQIQEQFRAMVGSRVCAKSNQGPDTRLSVGDFDMDDLDGAFGEEQTVQTLVKEHTPNHQNVKVESKLAKFRENDDDFFLDFDKSPEIGAEDDNVSGDILEVLKKRIEQSTSADRATRTSQSNNEEEYRDPFMDEFEDDDRDFVEDTGQSLVARQTVQVEKLINLLRPDQDAETVLNACAKLTTLFREQPSQRRTLLTHHGVIPIMEMLEMSNQEVLHAVLKVVGQIIENDREFQELLSLAGLIPVVSKFCQPSVSRPIRLQAAWLVKQFLKTSSVTLQMLIACGGLPVLAGLLIPCNDSEESHPDVALGCVAVDGIKSVFELSSLGTGRGTIPRNDFCRLLAKEGVLRRLVGLLEHCRSPKGEAECAALGFQAETLILEIADILQVFTHGDAVVKQYFADTTVLEGILRTLTLEAPFDGSARGGGSRKKKKKQQKKKDDVPVGKSGYVALDEDQIGPLVKTLLKCVKNLCMDPSVLETLESAGAIPTLVPFLSYCSTMSKLNQNSNNMMNENNKKRAGGKATVQRSNSFVPGSRLSAAQEQLVKEVQNLVMLAMFYLCRLSRSRQEQAAVSGIIPHLMDAIVTRSPVKTFALQILTDFAHTSDLTRDQLWRCNALDFYLDLLVSGDVFWQEKAFTSLGAWLSNATPEVERAMLRPRSLQRLVTLFQFAQSNNFENYVKELLVMLSSDKLAEAIGRSGLFMAELVARLSFPKAEVRINLLKMLKIIADRHEDLEHLVLEHNLFPVVTGLAKQAQDSHRVLVMQIATQLLEDWRAQLLA